MSWQAPVLHHLLDQRLQAARLELLDDQRMERARQGEGAESVAFLRHLVEEKFSAAARSGLGAVEASLRTSATDYLIDAGCGAGDIRAALDARGQALVALRPATRPGLPAGLYTPRNRAGIFLLFWMATITLGKVLNKSDTRLYLFLVLCGGVGAVVIYGLSHGAERRHRSAIARDYPAQQCGAYLRALAGAIAQYEQDVNRLATESVPS